MRLKKLCRTDPDEFAADENTIRGTWSHGVDFILSLIGYTVGFGNVWRFPYLCYRNGGGAFLVPYFLVLAVAGLPLYFLELGIGQFSSLGPVTIWKMCPLFKGVGIAAVTITGIINVYYNTLVAYVLFYLFASMTSQLPWATCGNEWNTAQCRVYRSAHSAFNSTLNVTNITDMAVSTWSPPSGEIENEIVGNGSMLLDANLTRPKSPAEEYFERHVLELTSGIDDIGHIRWQLLLCLILAWVVGFICLLNGIKSTGKVVYFTATFPYVILLILLIRGLTLEGSFDGLRYYLIPKWSELANPKVWGDAAAQIFYSLGPAWGCLISFASYNKFHNNFHRDTLICSLVCCATSVFAGLVIFSVVGFMAHDLGLPVDKVMASGPGLAFIAYPEAISRMPFAPFWSIVFFAMLLTAGLDSMFAQVEVVVVAISDEFPDRLRKNKRWLLLVVCILYFLVGLPQITQGGIYVLNLIDWYFASFSLFIIAFLETICVVYIYGYNNVAENFEIMLGFKPNIFYRICWGGLTPAIVAAICVFNAIIYTPATYNDYTYPRWANALGWAISIIPVASIPGYMIYHYLTTMGSLRGVLENLALPWTGKTFRDLTRPSKDWGPMMPQYRREAGFEPSEVEVEFLEKTAPSGSTSDVTPSLPKIV